MKRWKLGIKGPVGGIFHSPSTMFCISSGQPSSAAVQFSASGLHSVVVKWPVDCLLFAHAVIAAFFLTCFKSGNVLRGCAAQNGTFHDSWQHWLTRQIYA